MKSRDRIVVVALAAAALLAAFWFLALGPKRDEAKALSARVVAAQERLAQAQAKARNGRQAKAGYESDYATVVQLGAAVPADDRVASLINQLESASRHSRIEFSSVQSGTAAPNSAVATTSGAVAAAGQSQGGSASSGGTATPASGANAVPAGATVGAAGFPTMPFTFAFDGPYEDLRHLVSAVNRFVEVDGSQIVVRGRLLQINGISLSPNKDDATQVTATLNATAYLLPPTEGVTNGATPSTPGAAAPAAAGTGSTPTSTAITTGGTG